MGADLTQVDFQDVNLSGSDLNGASLTVTTLIAADLTKADLTDAVGGLSSLTGTRWSAQTSGGRSCSAQFWRGGPRNANLRDADLSRSDLIAAKPTGANLPLTRLDQAHASGVPLTEAKIRPRRGSACSPRPGAGHHARARRPRSGHREHHRSGMFLLQRKPFTGLLFVATITLMEIEFDPEKSAKNARERGLPFELAAELEWDKAYAFADDRRDYGEERSRPRSHGRTALRRLLSDFGARPQDHQFPQGERTRGESL